MTLEQWIILGVGLGCAGGALGGFVGTYFAVKNTNSAEERAFVIRCSVVAWIVILLFLAGLILIPMPFNMLLWIPYGILLPVSIIYWNRKQASIRANSSG